MWWRRKKERLGWTDSQREPPFFFRHPSFEVRLEVEPLPLQEEEHIPLSPALLIGLGREGVEVLKRVKASLLAEVGHTERVGFTGVLLQEDSVLPSSFDISPLKREEVLAFSPRYGRIARPFLWWKPEFATAREAARIRGRMLWFWDQLVSGERRLTTHIESNLTSMDISTKERLQVLIFGEVASPEFATALDVSLWIRRHVMNLFGVTLFGITRRREEAEYMSMQAAALWEMRRYTSTTHLWLEDEGGMPIVWNKFLFDHVFLFSEESIEEWSEAQAVEEIYAALTDLSIAFLDQHASSHLRDALSKLHRPGSVYSIGGLRTWVWKGGVHREKEAQRLARRVVGENVEVESGIVSPVGDGDIKRFYDRHFPEVEGERSFPFNTLLTIARGETPPEGFVLPQGFRDGLRWRLLLFLNEEMNAPHTSMAEGLAAGYRFADGLFRWWANLRRFISRAAPKPWAQPLLSEIPGILEDIHRIKQEMDLWARVWGKVAAPFNTELQREQKAALLAFPQVRSRRYFGESITNASHRFGGDNGLELRFRERMQWRWQESAEHYPVLVVATFLKESAAWPVYRSAALGKCVVDAAQKIVNARLQSRVETLGLDDFPDMGHYTDLPSQGFLSYAIVQKKARHLLFIPSKVRDNLGSSASALAPTSISWGFPARVMYVAVEGGIALNLVEVWKESMEYYFDDPSLHVFVQEQRFAQLKSQYSNIQWSPEFVNLLASEDALHLAALAFWYGWLQLEYDAINRKTICSLVSPRNEIVERVALKGDKVRWIDLFTLIAQNAWENSVGLWGQWVRHIKELVPQWLQTSRHIPWDKRQDTFRKREEILEKWGDDRLARSLKSYLSFVREKEQWA